MSFVEALPYVAVVVGAVVATALVMYAMMGKRKKKPAEPTISLKSPSDAVSRWTFRAEHTVSSEEAHKAREQLRTLELEREILSDAIRRLYEAQAEGKITERERDALAEEYKAKMLRVKDAISQSQSIAALQELEAMQEDLVKLFDERFDELNMKIEELRSKVQVETERETPEIPVSIEASSEEDEEEEEEEISEIPAEGAEQKIIRKKKPKPKPSPTGGKTEAEKRIEQIREEVEKVLERLGQMEVET